MEVCTPRDLLILRRRFYHASHWLVRHKRIFDHSGRFPAEREQFSGPHNKWTADSFPYRSKAHGLETKLKPSIRHGYQPSRSTQALAVTGNDLGDRNGYGTGNDEVSSLRA